MAEQSTETRKKLVAVCIDESKHSEKAVEWMFDHVYKEGMEIALIHIHVLPDLPAFGLYTGASVQAEVYHESIQLSVSKSKATIEKFANVCKDRGVTPKLFVETMQESIGHTITKIISDQGVDFVVIGQRGLGTFRRTFLGSVSDYIVHHLSVPAIIIPPDEE